MTQITEELFRHGPDMNRREGDAESRRIEQKLDDHIETVESWRENHEKWLGEHTDEFQRRISILEAFNKRIDIPLKLISWVLITILTVVLGGVGMKIIRLMEEHWK